MIAHYEIEQHSEEWHKIRYGKVGGTLSKGLFVKSDTLLLDILSELTEEFDLQENYQSYDMIRGTELEPEAKRALNSYLGIELLDCGWLQCEENEYIGISPDGITECETISAEIKCPGAKKHLSTVLSGEIPKDNIDQCLHYFTVNPKLEKHYFFSYRPENKLKPIFIKELTRDSVIDLGLKKKVEVKQFGVGGKEIKPKIETVTDYRTIAEWVSVAKFEGGILKQQIKETINQLSF